MGVFAMFRRKAKNDGESPEVTEAQAGPVTDAPAPEAAEEPAGDAEGVTQPQEAAQAPGTAQDRAEGAADAVEIPKQQSAEQAADSEAGESARK
jgi:hypothetical protein